MTAFYRIFILLICFVPLMLINGCNTTSPSGNLNQVFLAKSSKDYLQQAKKSEGTEKQHYQLLAAHRLLTENNIHEAERLLNTFSNQQLDSNIYRQKLILDAKLLLKKNKPKTAIQKLNQVNKPEDLPTDIKIVYYVNTIEAFSRTHQIEKSVLAEITLNDLLGNASLSLDIWHTLQTLPLEKLYPLRSQVNSNTTVGWIDLAILAKQEANQPIRLIHDIQDWQKQYPHHSANGLFPQEDLLTSCIQTTLPDRIALLLPLQGSFGKMGRAVRDGFMTAFYQDAEKLSRMPDIKVYDTSQNRDVKVVYQKAIQEGAQFVIGPLVKERVEQLSKEKIKVPILVLNYLPSDKKKSYDFIQFGLSSEQAAEQVATHAWQHGAGHLLTITPNSEWGNNVRRAFVKRWEQLGGQVTHSLSFSTMDQRLTEIPAALNIDQSNQRTDALEELLNKKLKVTARRRQDIDSIFLVATPAQAKQIQPLLRFYYAGNIPIFGISSIYQGYSKPSNGHDLSGIYFNDMPWLLSKDSLIISLKQRIQSLWPTDYKANNRLYALGIDSYLLSTLLPRLVALPNFPINGVTGQLYLKTNRRIYRQLLWAQFSEDGTPQLLT